MPRNEEIDDVYSENFNEELEESDEINESEQAFMHGYNEENSNLECANCRNILDKYVIEHEINDKLCKFCSKKCLKQFVED